MVLRMARFPRAPLCCPTPRTLLWSTSSLRKDAALSPPAQPRGTRKAHSGNALTSAPSPCTRSVRSFGPPRPLFVEMRERDVVSWTAEISSLNKRNRGDRALLVFNSMLAQGARPNYVTVLCVVRAIGAVGLGELSGGIHALAVKSGLMAETSVRTVLMGLYSSLQAVDRVLRLFHHSESKDLVLWTALVSALSKNGRFLEALDTFRGLIRDNIVPNYVSVMGALSACAGLSALSTCRELHGYAVRNFPAETNLQNALVDVYAKCNQLGVSIAVFDKIRAKDSISWNTIISRCTEHGQPRKALDMFLRMRCCEARTEEKVIGVILTACLQSEAPGFALGMHCFVIKINLYSSTCIGTALLRVYADVGKVEMAREVFDEIPQKDLIAWTAMVSVYAKAGCPQLAVGTFRQMPLANGGSSNGVTLVSLLEACSSLGAQRHGRSIHAHVLRLGHSFSEYMTSAFIDFYCKIGRVGQGEALFAALENKDLVCWGSMINGYGINGCGEEAVGTFLEMLEHGLKPNGVVFLSILSACSHCGMADEGWRWFCCMEEKHGVCPTLAHYSCIVDMLSRWGRVKEALDFIREMPMEPDVRIWGTLFAGCKVAAGDVKVAEVAAGWLMRLDPGNSSYYVALSNLYAELGRWSEVERVRRSLEWGGLRKMVGYSLL